MKGNLGHVVHTLHHEQVQFAGSPDFPYEEEPAPGPHRSGPFRATAYSSSIIAAAHDKREDFPPPHQVNAIDRRLGLFEDESVEEWRNRVYGALIICRQWSRTAQNLVHFTCIEGDLTGAVQVLPQQIRHNRIQDAANHWFQGDVDRAEHWLDLAWQFLALLLATPIAVEQAQRAGAVYKPGVRWLRERGMMK